jgi:hypothetical protein
MSSSALVWSLLATSALANPLGFSFRPNFGSHGAAKQAVGNKYSNLVSSVVHGTTAPIVSQLQLFSQYSAAAYCSANENPAETILTCSAKNCPLVEANGARTIFRFQNTKNTDNTGFIAVDNNARAIVLAFRGSLSEANWLADFQIWLKKVDWCTDCRVHEGFLGAWNEVKPQVITQLASAIVANPSFRIVVTGHSLGAAIATVAAGDLRRTAPFASKIEIYSYGSPRVANQAMAAFLTSQSQMSYRVTAVDDPITREPPTLLGYVHVSPEYWLKTNPENPGPSDIDVVIGFNNNAGNAGTTGRNGDSHTKKYFGPIARCAGPDSSKSITLVKRDSEELVEREASAEAQEIMEWASNPALWQ